MHMHGLKQCMGPQNKRLEVSGETGVTFEDNLFSHNTDEGLSFWGDELPRFVEPRSIPANMTENLQVIHRHIRTRYKEHVYLYIRRESTKMSFGTALITLRVSMVWMCQ